MIFKFTLDRFEGEQAVLTGENGAKATWPKSLLPAGVREGASLSIEIIEEKEREKKDRQTAKNIINEIINNS